MTSRDEMVKLSAPQIEALNDLGDQPRKFADHWPPIKKLVDLGFATRRDAKWGGGLYEITPAGSAFLIALIQKDTSHVGS